MVLNGKTILPNLMKHHDENRNKGYILEADIEYPKDLHDLHSDLPFLHIRLRIKKCSKLVRNLYECCTHKNME